MTPQELGPYLLLRKLSENALCETYRAGQRSGQEVERVVLLYFFNCEPDDSLWISETAHAGRRALAGLDSASLSPAIDSGEIGGTAYLTYDYIPGRSLEVVLEKARSQQMAIPLEHALLVTDRIGQGLQAAWEHESRALHGFVVPHLVMLSNEGDVQLLGLEVASRLRKLLAATEVREQMGRYLAPEVVPEGQPSTTDDVFSLGAILYELATGKSLPVDAAANADALLDKARTHDGQLLPPPVVDLLKTSITPAFGRSDLKSWKAQLSGLLASGEYDASAFNLALFLHTLFADEIESEAEEAEGERDLLGSGETDLAVAEIASLVGGDDDGPPNDVDEDMPAALLVEPADAASNRGRFLGIAAAIIVFLAAGFGAFTFFGPSDSSNQSNIAASEPTPLAAPVLDQRLGESTETIGSEMAEPDPVEQAPGLSPEQIDERVQALLSQRSADMESSLRQEFESELAALRQQLEQAREEAAAAEALDAAAAGGETPADVPSDEQSSQLRLASLSEFEQPDDAAGDPAAAGDSTTFEPQGQDPTAESIPLAAAASEPDQTVEDRTGVETTDLLNLESTVSAPGEAAPEPAVFTAPARTAPQQNPTRTALEPEEQASEPPAQPVATNTPPQVQIGDLVTPGPDVTSPKISEPPRPVYPMMARRLRRSATVTMKILVDENGRVIEAERLGDEAGYGFDSAALQAALKSRWEPAMKDGVQVKMWWTVRIAFQP